MFKKIIVIILGLLVFFPVSAHALEPQVDAAYTVSAVVPTQASPPICYSTLSANEILADPSSHSVLLTVYVFDGSHNPLAGIPVKITSNRGASDIIEAVSKIGTGDPNMNIDNTDATGRVFFRLTSWMPGDAAFSILVDNSFNLPEQTVKFLPLPFPSNVTVTVPLPGTEKKIILVAPEPEKPLTTEQKEAKKLVNTGTEIRIPFWIFIMVVLWVFLIPLFIIFIALGIRKIRRTERREMMLLAKIAEAEHIDHVREFLKKEGIGK